MEHVINFLAKDKKLEKVFGKPDLKNIFKTNQS